MLKLTALLCGFLAVAASDTTTTPVSKCVYHKGGLPVATNIVGCAEPPCQLPQLQDVVLNIVFKAPYNMKSMKTLATAYIFGPIGIPYDLGAEALTCNFLTNSHCPVLEGEVVTYTLRMYIESYFPVGTSVTIEFRIVDESSQPVVCIRVPVQIVAALPSGDIAGHARNSTMQLTGH